MQHLPCKFVQGYTAVSISCIHVHLRPCSGLRYGCSAISVSQELNRRIIRTSFSSGLRLRYFVAASFALAPLNAGAAALAVSAKTTPHCVAGNCFGSPRRAASLVVLVFVLLAVVSAVFDAGFLTLVVFTAVFFFAGFLVGFFGFLPTFAFPAAVFGPGFLAVVPALVVRLVVVLPVCAFGLPTGFEVAAAVAYERVEDVHIRNKPSYVDENLMSLSSVEELTRASHGLYPNRVTALKLRPASFADNARLTGNAIVIALSGKRSGELCIVVTHMRPQSTTLSVSSQNGRLGLPREWLSAKAKLILTACHQRHRQQALDEPQAVHTDLNLVPLMLHIVRRTMQRFIVHTVDFTARTIS